MVQKEIQIPDCSYTIKVLETGALLFRTRRFGIIDERELLKIISEVSENKRDNAILRGKYAQQLKKERARLKDAPPGELQDADSKELYGAIERYCSFDPAVDNSAILAKRKSVNRKSYQR